MGFGHTVRPSLTAASRPLFEDTPQEPGDAGPLSSQGKDGRNALVAPAGLCPLLSFPREVTGSRSRGEGRLRPLRAQDTARR